MNKILQYATLGGGCFWCLEAVYQLVNGVSSVVSGYTAGQVENPTYSKVCDGDTGHAEVVKIEFDASVISYNDILEIFWVIHDPTTLNRQGNDSGTQYRSMIIYHSEDQKIIAEESKKRAAAKIKNPIVTEIVREEKFYPAEKYHQNYFQSNPENSYCFYVVKPKIEKFLKNFPTSANTKMPNI
jgi:peptide-methionine (S)-S-oxide reductase